MGGVADGLFMNIPQLSWFVAPTVALVEQQRDVIATQIPVSVGLVSGASDPDQWKDPSLWRAILDSHRVMVTTPQVLLDALRHGYVKLGADISLLIFDEVHHAGKNHPYNVIMKEFYHGLPPRGSPEASEYCVRPMVLGLTASPIFGGDADQAFRCASSKQLHAPHRLMPRVQGNRSQHGCDHSLYSTKS